MNKQQNIIRSSVIAAGLGILFGLGLGYSEMVNPVRVLGFLDISDGWDPTLAFVMVGALLITTPLFQYARSLRKPILAEKFVLPTKMSIDKRLVSGAVIFGIGWGLAGLCPGPAIVNLSTLQPQIFL
ncbi:MAG: YeeE/YedE family protein, partial [Pseudohongiellaceae bacterium]